MELADASGEAAVIWQVEEWVLDANEATQQTVNPGDTNMHKTSVAHANPTPDRAHGGGGSENHQLVPHEPV